jgi:hypothetical protein
MKSRDLTTFLLLAASAASFLLAPAVALGSNAGCLVDDPSLMPAVPASLQAAWDRSEAEFQKWLSSKSAAEVTPMAVIAPYKTLSTTSHKQIRDDYCGPATMAIMDHFLRGANAHSTQTEWAAYTYNGQHLWTDTDGAYMSIMAAGLRERTGKAYTYTTSNTGTDVYNRTEYAINSKNRSA